MMDKPKSFREWYIVRYGDYPGHALKEVHVVWARLADAFADYVDEVVQEKLGGSQ